MTRSTARTNDQLRPVTITRAFHAEQSRQRALPGRRDRGPCDGEPVGHGAAVPGRQVDRLADGRIRHAAGQYVGPGAPRHRRPGHRDSAADRPQPARRRRSHGARSRDNSRRRRRPQRRRRHPHRRDHRRVRCGRRCARSAGSTPTRCAASLRDSVAAVSAGIVAGEPCLDLDYREDSTAEVDINVVRLGRGGLVEVQGTGEGATFSRRQLDALLDLAGNGIDQLTKLQRDCLGADWPFRA